MADHKQAGEIHEMLENCEFAKHTRKIGGPRRRRLGNLLASGFGWVSAQDGNGGRST
jgi:hypothetical protein